MPGWTNRGKYMAIQRLHNGTAPPSNYYIALVTSATAPSVTTNTLSDLTQINTGNGYTDGGFTLSLNSTDFTTATEDDSGNLGRVTIKDVSWTASGGAIPNGGSGARYAVLTDDNPTVSSREVYYYWDLTSDRSISATQTLTLQNMQIHITET